jgi:hypothetical protein
MLLTHVLITSNQRATSHYCCTFLWQANVNDHQSFAGVLVVSIIDCATTGCAHVSKVFSHPPFLSLFLDEMCQRNKRSILYTYAYICIFNVALSEDDGINLNYVRRTRQMTLYSYVTHLSVAPLNKFYLGYFLVLIFLSYSRLFIHQRMNDDNDDGDRFIITNWKRNADVIILFFIDMYKYIYNKLFLSQNEKKRHLTNI